MMLLNTLTHGRPWTEIPPTGPLLRPQQAAEYLGLSVQRFYELAAEGRVPSPFKIGARASGVPRPWLDACIAGLASAGGQA